MDNRVNSVYELKAPQCTKFLIEIGSLGIYDVE